ncbi:MAG: glycosyltransferase family 4 protein [Candidatus Acidiferrales bacterium]
MRILFVSTNLPIPPNNGQAIRTLSVLRALRSLGHELTFVSFAPAVRPATLEPLSSCCATIDLLDGNSNLTNMSQRSDYFGRIRCLLSLKPYSVERFHSVAMRAKIRQRLDEVPFDLIVCDSLYVLVNVPPTHVPIVLNCHNVEHVILQRYAELEKNYAKKWYANFESRLMSEAERSACARAAVAMACSEHDRDKLSQLRPSLPICVVPNAVDTDSFQPSQNGSGEDNQPVILFQGGMDWYPNRDAVEFFAHQILPLVRAVCPDVRFVVAGRNPPAYLVDEFRSDTAIQFTGTVPDMAPYLTMATLVVVPLRLGSGTRIKILEGCAAGKAVVSTSVGAEGLALEPGREILLADDPAEIARSVIELLRDSERRNAIGAAGRAAVVERYSERALKDSVQTALSLFATAQIPAAVDRTGSCLQQSASCQS